jgi:Tol biopolymer transport system component
VRRFALLVIVLLAAAGCGSSASPKLDLLFVSTRDGDYALYGVDAGGGHEQRLTKGRGEPTNPRGLFYAFEPAWSSDGRWIAFVSKRDGAAHVYVMQADGSGLRRVTNTSREDGRPTWSPDGRQIAFAREDALYVVPSSGGRARRLGRALAGRVAGAAWSHDGRSIAFDFRPDGSSSQEIWVVGADGRRPRRVTNLRGLSGYPSWSPDDRRLAFHSNVQGGHFEIYSIAVGGSGLRHETRSSIDTIDPAWSPDGQKIAFARDGAIWTVDSGGREREITSGDNDSAPAWRPAGAAAQG